MRIRVGYAVHPIWGAMIYVFDAPLISVAPYRYGPFWRRRNGAMVKFWTARSMVNRYPNIDYTDDFVKYVILGNLKIGLQRLIPDIDPKTYDFEFYDIREPKAGSPEDDAKGRPLDLVLADVESFINPLPLA